MSETTILAHAPTDLDRLRSETPFVEAEVSLAQVRVEDARRSYQAGRLALADLVEVESVLSAALLDLDTHRAALADLDRRQAQQEKRDRIAALNDALERNAAARLERMTAALVRLETAELALHDARLYVRQERQAESALIDAGRQDLAQLQALEGHPSPAVATLATLAERRDYDALLDFWRLSDGDRLTRMDADALHTVAEAVEVEADHRARWTPVLAQITSLRSGR